MRDQGSEETNAAMKEGNHRGTQPVADAGLQGQADARLCHGDALSFYNNWPSPKCIISDGAYGVGGFPGDPKSPDRLADWYHPHVEAWSMAATPATTLWFWNTEIGWANAHPLLAANGWEYAGLNVWNKGRGFVAGNVNTGTIRHFPTVTEVCAQYVRRPEFRRRGDNRTSMQDWLREEWRRSGLPWSEANTACGVKAAATRKWLAADHLWYMPPRWALERLADYANAHGKADGRPYFDTSATDGLDMEPWEQVRGTFHCPFGVTNVWDEPALMGSERLKADGKAVHGNQKPLSLIERIILASTDTGDAVWDPFAGLFTAAIAARRHGRKYYGAEIKRAFYDVGIVRYETEFSISVKI